jgi:hypothetical protein
VLKARCFARMTQAFPTSTNTTSKVVPGEVVRDEDELGPGRS